MYPSAFCQPSYRQSWGTEAWVRRSRSTPERTDANQPFIHLSSHQQPQSYATPPSLDRTQYLQLLHHQSLARAHRRTLLARREAERQAERYRHQQAELRAYHLAEREARVRANREARLFVDREARVLAGHRAHEERRRRMRDEGAEFVELIDGLFHGITRSYANAEDPHAEEELETAPAHQFSDSESEVEQEEDAAMRGLFDSSLHGFKLQDELQDASAVLQNTKPSDAQHPQNSTPVETHDESQESEDPLQAIHQAYTANKARVQRLETLDALHQNLVNLVERFTLPPFLDFNAAATSSATNDPSIPELKFTSRNTPYHAHAQSLLALLVEADAVASDGDEEVRARRKEFVGLVEGELDALESAKRRVWEEQRGQD